jgi:hypothetical protein
MSGGVEAPPAPRFGQPQGNSTDTFNTATGNASQTMNTAQAYNTNAQNQLNTTLGTVNNMSGLIGQQAQGNVGSYQTNFQPLQATEAQAAQNYGSQANLQRLQGQAVANTQAGVQAGIQNQRAALASEGVDPASLRGNALDQQSQVMGAAGAANAGTQASIQGQQQAFGMENQANQIGLGVGQQGMMGASGAAGVANQGQMAMNQTNQAGVQNLTAANQYLQTGNQANAGLLNAQQQAYADMANQWTQNQQSQSAMGAAIGTAGGVLGGAAGSGGLERGGPVEPQPHPMGIPTMANGGIAMASPFVGGGMVGQKGALPTSPIPGSTDTRPALLTPGEFVMPKDVVDFKGADHFHKMIDSIREQKNKRMAIPLHHPPHVSMH